jgi:hypothetical protein
MRTGKVTDSKSQENSRGDRQLGWIILPGAWWRTRIKIRCARLCGNAVGFQGGRKAVLGITGGRTVQGRVHTTQGLVGTPMVPIGARSPLRDSDSGSQPWRHRSATRKPLWKYERNYRTRRLCAVIWESLMAWTVAYVVKGEQGGR